ncbi:histidine kinase [Hymenobacter sp. BT664]|uniref:Histidine kinase n=1 Tax=Hymenobacter montanus TaxID=2771359 RepID=A0A927GJ84_9BACT|nr:histidine kinase [Hymenobacter montanus]MBD2768145.1 histidine kinase [Hymenobacter montanus]
MEAAAPLLSAGPSTLTGAPHHRISPQILLRLDRWELSEPRVRLGGTWAVAVAIWLADGRGPWWLSLLLSLVCTTICWEGNRGILFALRRRFPDFESTTRRLSWQVGACLLYTATAAVLFAGLHYVFEPAFLPPVLEGYWHCLLLALIPTAIVMAIYESTYFFGEWKRYYLRAAWLETERAESQLAALKQQVDPHFLFNTLNTLAALVGDNPPAQAYLDELANVYRYVLTRRDQTTVTIAEEMAFVESYVYLNRIRYEHAVEVDNHLPAEVLQRRVPPLAIQMLVENALKHNAASPQRPLRIELRAEEGYVSVTNNVQPKTKLARGEGVGLRNLQQQFQLLAGREMLIQSGPAQFAVKLPLLNPHASRTN